MALTLLAAGLGGLALALFIPRGSDPPQAPTPVLIATQTIAALTSTSEASDGGRQLPWGLILQKPPRKEATSVRIGDTLTAVGWSPPSARGQPYGLCVPARAGASFVESCLYVSRRPYKLKGTMQTFGTWTVRAVDVKGGVFKMTLKVKRKARASDTVPVR